MMSGVLGDFTTSCSTYVGDNPQVGKRASDVSSDVQPTRAPAPPADGRSLRCRASSVRRVLCRFQGRRATAVRPIAQAISVRARITFPCRARALSPATYSWVASGWVASRLRSRGNVPWWISRSCSEYTSSRRW